MKIFKLGADEAAPMELLLLADPSPKIVEEYLKRGRMLRSNDGGATSWGLCTAPHKA